MDTPTRWMVRVATHGGRRQITTQAGGGDLETATEGGTVSPGTTRFGSLLHAGARTRLLLFFQIRWVPGTFTHPELESLTRQRLAAEVTLGHIAVERREPIEHRAVFYALGHNLQPKLMPETDGGADNGFGIRVFRHIDHEGFIDLDRVYRQLFEIAERGIAGAKIVDEQQDSHFAQTLQYVQRSFRILHHCPFGDLELERARLGVPFGQQMLDLLHQRTIPQIVGRKIDCDR